MLTRLVSIRIGLVWSRSPLSSEGAIAKGSALELLLLEIKNVKWANLKWANCQCIEPYGSTSKKREELGKMQTACWSRWCFRSDSLEKNLLGQCSQWNSSSVWGREIRLDYLKHAVRLCNRHCASMPIPSTKRHWALPSDWWDAF